MTLVADSGSTKTTWAVVGTRRRTVTEGLNPHFTTDGQFFAACATVRQQFSILNFQFSIYFYGSGCGSEVQRQRVVRLLTEAFGTADVHVETDMLGACRAVCGDRAGLVGILGTGSNACYYDGSAIRHQAVSTGYILGDQGSANHVGRLLLNSYLTHRMPEELRHMFHDTYRMSDEQLMDAVYHQPHPNRFLASLAPFVLSNKRYNFCYQMLMSSLREWYHFQVEEVRRVSRCSELSVVGGFGARLKTTLLDFAAEENLAVGTVMADPIGGLLRYHAQR